MILLLSNTKSMDKDTMTINYSLLADKGVHLFIASNIWDRLIVEVSEEIPDDVLKYIVLKCKNKEAILPDRKLTQREVSLLCEMYPEKAGRIRKETMLNRDITGLLKEG